MFAERFATEFDDRRFFLADAANALAFPHDIDDLVFEALALGRGFVRVPFELRIHLTRSNENHQFPQPRIKAGPEAQELIDLAMERVELRAVKSDAGRAPEADERPRVGRDLVVEALPDRVELIAVDRR
jgi:hypothetical protein